MDRDELYKQIDKSQRRLSAINRNCGHSPLTWLSFMEQKMKWARVAFTAGNKEDAMRHVLSATAVGVSCLEQHGQKGALNV